MAWVQRRLFFFFLLFLLPHSSSSSPAVVLHRLVRPVRAVDHTQWIAPVLVYGTGVVSLVQATHTLLTHSLVVNEIARRMFSPDKINSLRRIRSIISDVHEKHGVVDILKTYPTRVVLSALYAMSKLQDVVTRAASSTLQQPFNTTTEHSLLQDLSHYAIFASVAYGWKLEFALRGKLHGRGDVNALLTRTGLTDTDVVKAVWDASASRPAYFIVRDHNRSSIVLSIRGTFCLDDLLTDLCCTPEEFAPKSRPKPLLRKMKSALRHFSEADYPTESPGNQAQSGHLGMLEAAQSLQAEVESVLEEEIKAHPGYSLVIVGHSLGGGVASLLGTLMEETFSNLYVYAYGPPCVAPSHAKLHKNIVSVVAEGDPFRCLSLGHIAGMSEAIAELCQDEALRSQILRRARKQMPPHDVDFCLQTLEELRGRMKAEKLYPPGRILFVSEPQRRWPFQRRQAIHLSEVSPDFFQDFFVPTVFDLTHHSPASYEAALEMLVDQA